MATIRAVPRSRSTSQVVPIYEDPRDEEDGIPTHDIHLDHDAALEPEDALADAIQHHEAPEKNFVQDAIKDFEELASPEHDAALAAEYDDNLDDEDLSDTISDDDDDDDDDDGEDPFETSDITQDGHDIRHSIEHDTPFRHERFSGHTSHLARIANHGYDRSFSTTTAIHLDDHVSPQMGSSDEEDPFDTSENLRLAQEENGMDEQDRKISETWSALPDEVHSYYKSPLPGRSMLNSHTRSPLSASRSHLASPPSPSPLANRERLLSSPTRSGERYLATPTRHSHAGRLQHEDDPRQYAPSGRPVFRNPSSVIRLQMSSPPPFPPSSPPRSARHKREQSEALRGSRHGSPFPALQQSSNAGTPTRHADPKKEYPLVLLHCTLSPLPSTFAFSPAVLEQVLPAAKLRDVALLKERLGAGGTTVLERGVLVPHPGDDYELLEERVLESLELRRPRVGGCGHFNPNADMDGPLYQIHEEGQDAADCKCADCGQHMDHALLPADQNERRWDVRVYAANGLMRSGAWSAAWREMEKVDVEVGVWLPDDLRQALESAGKEESDRDELSQIAPQIHDEYSIPNKNIHGTTILPPPAPMPPSDARDADHAASTAAARPPSRPKQRGAVRGSAEQYNKARKQELRQQRQHAQLPLQTLLLNYMVRTAHEQRGLLLAIAILVAGIWLAFSSGDRAAAAAAAANAPAVAPVVLTTTSTSVLTSFATEVAAAATATVTHTEYEAVATESVGSGVEPATVTVTVTATAAAEEREAQATVWGFDACTFAAEDGEENGMTALPASLARSVLDAVPSAGVAAAAEDQAPMEQDEAGDEPAAAGVGRETIEEEFEVLEG